MLFFRGLSQIITEEKEKKTEGTPERSDRPERRTVRSVYDPAPVRNPGRGGFGSYAAFPSTALWLCSVLMLMGRLECMTVLVLLLPRFWKK